MMNIIIVIHLFLINFETRAWCILIVSGGVRVNPHMPDRFTRSHARCAENCGSALTHR